jgi:hypothetical protein
MELFLNLVWLLLALPAYWLWRNARGARCGRLFGSLQCFLALAGALILLFPVVSATDDLHAMRAEIEESGPNKRNIRQSAGDRGSIWTSRWHGTPAIAVSIPSFGLRFEGWRELRRPALLIPAAPSILGAGRAPPVSFLG